MPDPSGYSWDRRTQQYRHGTTGKFVPRADVRAALEKAVDAAAAEVNRLASDLQRGTIDIDSWWTGTTAALKRLHVASGTLAAGGQHAVTPAVLGRIGARLKSEYGYLNAFARELADGLPVDGQFLARASMYADAAVGTFEGVRRAGMRSAGYTRERRHLGGVGSEHCSDCVGYAAQGWQPIGTLPGIGQDCRCHSRCHCSFAYSRDGDATMAAATIDNTDSVAAAVVRSPAVTFNAKVAPAVRPGPLARSLAVLFAAAGKGGSGAGSGMSRHPSRSKLSGGRWVTIDDHPVYIGGGKGGSGGAAGKGKIIAGAGATPSAPLSVHEAAAKVQAGHAAGKPLEHHPDAPKDAPAYAATMGVRAHPASPNPVTDAHLHAVASEVAKVPKKMRDVISQAGKSLDVVSGRGITDHPDFAHYKGTAPRGWPEGHTWDNVPGAGGSRTIIVANRLHEGHGSTNLVVHEHAHTYDRSVEVMTGEAVSKSAAWRDLHARVPWKSSYERAYPEEGFAESVAKYYGSTPGQRASLHPDIGKFFSSHFGENPS